MPLIRKPNVAATAPEITSSDPLKLIESGDREERWAAARAAATVAGSVPLLAKALRSESDPQVREAMFTSLARMNSSESVNALLPFLRLESASLRTGALDALRAMPNVVRECLPRLLSDADSDIRVQSCEIARSLPSQDATRILCHLLSQETELNVCAAAIDVLAEAGNAEALPSLTQCAEKFKGMPFMAFAIRVATNRILSQPDQKSAALPSNPPQMPHG